MGRTIHIKEIRGFFKKSPVVDVRSIKKIIGIKDKGYSKTIINYLIKKGDIKRITKGFYTIHDDPSLAVFCFKPSYLGLQDALSIHNLWEQETNPVIITSKKIRQGTRKILGSNTTLKRIKRKYFFGVEYIRQGRFYFPVSDIEKTFIDMIYFKQRIDKDLLKNFKKRTDIKKFKKYLKEYPKRILKKVEKIFVSN